MSATTLSTPASSSPDGEGTGTDISSANTRALSSHLTSLTASRPVSPCSDASSHQSSSDWS